MDIQEAYAMEQLTKQERTSINRYLGFSHTSINLLINFDPKIYESLSNTGWLLPENQKDIERNIEDFVNIYSAMYKESRNRITPSFLVRGTSNKRAQELNGSVKQFLSTSTDESIAKTFTEYGDGALVYFSVDSNVPFLDTAPFLNEYSKNEHEIILSPFCESKITRETHPNTPYSFSTYDVTIKKAPLTEINPEELKALKDEILEGFSTNLKDMKEVLYLEGRLASLDRAYEQANGDSQEQAEILETKQLTKIRYDSYMANTIDYKTKLQRLLEGLCREKELEIDKAREMVNQDRKEQKEKEAEEKRKNTISSLSQKFSEYPSTSTKLQNNIETTYNHLINFQNDMNALAEKFGINLDTESPVFIKELVDIINKNIQSISQKVSETTLKDDSSLDDVMQISSKLTPLLDGIAYEAETSSTFPSLEASYREQLGSSFKLKLYDRVGQVLQNARLKKYSQEKAELQGKKIGFIGKLLGKEDLRQEQLKNLDLKIQLARSPIPAPQGEPHIREMLADMYICAIQDLGGNYTPEMQSLNDNMVTYFGNGNNGKFTKEYIQEIARQKMSREARPGSNLPTIKGKSKGFGKSKAQIQTLRQENSFIAQKLSSIRRNGANVSPVEKYNPEKDAFAIFRKKLKSIIAHITPDNDDHSHSREEFEFTLEDL